MLKSADHAVSLVLTMRWARMSLCVIIIVSVLYHYYDYSIMLECGYCLVRRYFHVTDIIALSDIDFLCLSLKY